MRWLSLIISAFAIVILPAAFPASVSARPNIVLIVDGDGDPDLGFGGDGSSKDVWVVGESVSQIRRKHALEAPADQAKRRQRAPRSGVR
ncbi:MAG: hypothetical protein ACREF9_15550 [Opitutaceae bacterium]